MALEDDLPVITPGKNEFLTFAENAVIPDMRQDDETYKDNIRRITGFVGGEPADNALMNTVLRNVTLAMKGFTDFIAENGVDVPQSVPPDAIRQGLTICIQGIIAKRVVEVVSPILENMQQQIDRFANAYHGVPVGGILPLSITEVKLEAFLKEYPCYAVCDGQNGTVDLRDRFILCASNKYKQGQRGGSATFNNVKIEDHKLTESEMPKHNHRAPGSQSPFAVDEWPFGAPLGSNEYIASATADRGYQVYTSSTGSNQGHSHEVSDKTSKDASLADGMMPPYYALIFVQKILPY